MKVAVVFPGQGSQAVGMLKELATIHASIPQTFARASEILGYDLWQLAQEGPEETLNQTDKTQPALLAAEVALWHLWRGQGSPLPVLMAGHSFGEYSALVCANSLSFEEAVRLVQDRGRFMQDAVPVGEGAVAAILGLEDVKIVEVCAQAAQGQIVSAVNFNAPGQVVIAGHKAAVERAMIQAKSAGAKRAMLLPISVPVHCSLMQPAAENMAIRLAEVDFQPPQIPILHNIDIASKTTSEAIRHALSAQINHPIRWVETIEKMAAMGVTHLVECGPGKVLSGLNKRIAKNLITLSIGDPANLEQTVQTLGNMA